MTKDYNDPRCEMSLEEIEAQVTREFNAKYPSLEAFENAHPVAQDFAFGGWGFERILDSVDLSRCKHPTKGHAEAARRNSYMRRSGATMEAK